MYSNETYLLEQLQESGLITERDVQQAQCSLKPGESVVEALMKTGVVSDEQIAQTVAVNSGMEYVDLNGFEPPPTLKALVPLEVALKYKIAPLGTNHNALQVVVADPFDFETLDALPHVLQPDIEYYCSTPSLIKTLQANIYGNEAVMGTIKAKGTEGSGDDDAPVIKLVTNMLMEAFKNKASDIHVEPLEKDIRIRYRMDGVLVDVEHHPKRLHAAIIGRIKIMTGSMQLDEKRIPQDGRIQMSFNDKEIDMRVSIIPTNHGESVVMRVLDKSSLRLGLVDLGFLSDDQAAFERLITLPDGIILVTGPTGSGKTTTLYACLNFINRPDRKIITVEDPVEYELAGINQVMVKEDIGMTFAAALRAMLRQAPNIIMLGEIRDLETASIAIQASLTGHLVFSTLHTNDAPSAVARLSDIGVKPFLIASAVRAIQAQRLVRKLCGDCKTPSTLSDRELRALGLEPTQLMEATIFGPNGCGKCRQGGYRGRMSLVEIFTVDDEVRNMINQQLTTPQLRKRARELGMRTLREDGIRKVLAGMTTAEEVIESTMSDAD
ncbi:MAG: Flp pilus assembly complex ATPase component TadA [Prosthecobacter sp.]|jgi:type IV pilus assembly protein PilB|uniref:GspE/PulE family protein n=1 Tax=Prosthecobacter sp. TaxID=1965333 RepID=UPI0019FD2883|nr:ATPase, T2SS/T4P/T4SS family [Prosthecobacter sp.]MBE2282350.1 Flp pilus assembly complex ATPase component TadA [Prosthecobacter sp.]